MTDAESNPITITINGDDGVSLTSTLTPDEAYQMALHLLQKSGMDNADSTAPLLEQVPWISINNPPIDFQVTDQGKIIMAVKPKDFRPIIIMFDADGAKEIKGIFEDLVERANSKAKSAVN